MWCAGVAIGWYLSRDKDPVGRTQRWILFTTAATVALLGAAIAVSVKAGQLGPSIDSPTRHERAQLPLAAALAYADTALAVATFIVVALRPARRQPRAMGTFLSYASRFPLA